MMQPFPACHKDLNSLINKLKHNSYLTIERFEDNSIKPI